MKKILIKLDPQDLLKLEKLADEYKTSISDVIKKLIREHTKEIKRSNLRKAPELLKNDYYKDSDLTIFTALDGESFLDESED